MPKGEQAADMNLKSSLELTSSLISQLKKSFFELQAYEDVTSDDIRWEDVEGHFRHLESVMKKELEELEAKQKLVSGKNSLLAEREAAVAAKEQDLVIKVQELKDATVAVIMEARNAKKVSCSVKDEIAGGNSPGKAENTERATEELTQFCERMNSKGILGYVMENLDNLSVVKQLTIALTSASDPARLVLDALGEFVSPNEMTQNREDVIQSRLVLMEAFFAFLAKADCDEDKFLTPEAKHRAKAFADEWKPNVDLDSADAINGNLLEARAFLWLLISFRIVSEFEREELCKFVLATAHHTKATDLCRFLDMNEKIPDIVQTLIDGGRYIEAVNFIMAFQLSDAFPPVPLLRTYMHEVRKNFSVYCNSDVQFKNNLEELAAVKVVMRCVKEHKLESEHPVDPFRRRRVQLQQAIRGERRDKEIFKLRRQKKERRKRQQQQRTGGGFYGSQAHIPSVPPPLSNEMAPYPGVADTYPSTGPSAYSYPVPGPSTGTSDQRPYSYPVSGQSTYAGPAPGTEPRPYYYGQDNRVGGSYSAGTPTYGSYVQPPQQPYM